MAGRNNIAIVVSLEAMAQAMQNQSNAGANGESHSLATFQRENPPTFKGKYDPEGVLAWLKEMERIFQVMPEDVCGKKEIEFLELKHGNFLVTEYAARFVELAKLYPHYNEETDEFSKCIKFESGLRPEIKKAIGYQKIRNFPDLVDSCRIYEEDKMAAEDIRYDCYADHRDTVPWDEIALYFGWMACSWTNNVCYLPEHVMQQFGYY
ncbi:uncharacterized protein LOC131649556 [Vicia villosa]|uniref:uncharacterized protein LOC131649556 n=1 Tax=Vicia villosa TaxID=3911 RepID=UPI00273BE82E|nr:uncharacterized protein LOC131649556 [Vicia villosa]